MFGAVRLYYNADGFLVNGNSHVDNNNGHSRGMALVTKIISKMKRYGNLFEELCSYENLKLAFKKARKGKTQKPYVIEFEKNLKDNLIELRTELLFHSYSPKPLKTFIIRDPKTRKISKSNFRDRIIHHALYNIIEPIFDKTFIYDSYANRIGKGTWAAIKRFDKFKSKIAQKGFVLKADIKHYFDEVDHKNLLSIIKKKIKDKKVIWLINKIICNHNSKIQGKGMPLGNLTSQFFANVYLNELDQFVKNKLKAKYYIRYVDDFVILHSNKKVLEEYKDKINDFLRKELLIGLHPEKCKILSLNKGICFLGYRVFCYHKLLRKTNLRKMQSNLDNYKGLYDLKFVDYDEIYEYFQGWLAYAKSADTYKLRKRTGQKLQEYFPNEISCIEINRLIKKSNIQNKDNN